MTNSYLNIITFLFIFFKIHPGTQTLALHYNVLVGVEWRGKGISLYLIPAAGTAISGVNYLIFRALKNKELFLAALTVFTSLAAQLILFASIIFLAKVN